MADYQARERGGDGWLRYYTFEPDEAEIEAYTYSVPGSGSDAGRFEIDEGSRFTLPWSGVGQPFVEIGSSLGVPSGGLATLRWSDLAPHSVYEWYAIASDGSLVASGTSDPFATP